mgnify:CR=1 FL=1
MVSFFKKLNDFQGFIFAIQAIILITALIVAVIQLKQAADDRKQENFVAYIARTAEHNWQIINDSTRQLVVEESLNLFIRNRFDEEEKQKYWASRSVQLSHIYLLWHVWELEIKNSKETNSSVDGWVRFAGLITCKLSHSRKPPHGDPFEWAEYDLWQGLQSYETHPKEFITWLKQQAYNSNDCPSVR